jgi:hypothetical protein
MILPVLLSAFAAGIIATSIMLFFLYLPLLWNGRYFDVLGALGSAITKEVDARTRLLGGVLYYAGGLLFAFLYGIAAWALFTAPAALPDLRVLPTWPVEINLVFPLIGIAIGLGHGIFVALLTTIVVIEHHPLERFHDRYLLIAANMIGHVVFGAVVMFFHSQFLQLLINRS